jgi:tetratricopeptide (TPR) repeat protein
VSLRSRKILEITFSLALAAAPASSQRTQQQPARPELPAGADRNDPWTYYRLAQSVLIRSPQKAADAYYWAARLNPIWAEAFYGRRIALLLSDPRMLTRYWRGDKGAVRETMGIDSLYLYALTLNPFLGPNLDHLILDAVIQEYARQYANSSGASPNDIAYEVQNYLRTGPPEWQAVRAYRDGRYDDALSFYAKAISRSKQKGPLLAERGRLFYQIGEQDSALVTLTQALVELRKEDKDDLVSFYQSKALMEERIGMIQSVKGDKAGAREAFGRALAEDLSYFPAHVQLAYLGLESRDTATVMNEMDLAVSIRPDDPGIRYQYGFALGSLNKLKEAEVQLTKSIELDPDFAAPHFTLADVYQASGRKPQAIKEYETFLSLAAKNDTRREEADQMMAILKGSE